MRAVIDIGTNSVRLLITSEGISVARDLIITRLGRGVDHEGRLSQKAMDATVQALLRLKEQTDQYGVTPVVVATSAVRDAANRREFIELVRERLGWEVEVLSGDEEARFSFHGATAALQGRALLEPAAVVDIGGGSTEIYVGTAAGTLLSGGSVQVGAVRMTERHITGHPIDPMELRALEDDVKRRLAPLVDNISKFSPQMLIGVGGTVTTLAVMSLQLLDYDPDTITGCELTRDDIEAFYEELGRLSIAERQQIPGLPPGRADILPAGTGILWIICQMLGIDRCIVSDGDLLQGILAQF